MIYKLEEYVEQANPEQETTFPLKRIEVLTPLDGSRTRYVGHVTLGIQTPVGVQQFPISFDIEAEDVADAFKKFEQSAEPKIEEARRGLEEEVSRVRREASSRIISPGELGLAGGSKIVDLKNPRL